MQVETRAVRTLVEAWEFKEDVIYFITGFIPSKTFDDSGSLDCFMANFSKIKNFGLIRYMMLAGWL